MADPTKALDLAMADATSLSSNSSTVHDPTQQHATPDALGQVIPEKSQHITDDQQITTAQDWTGPDDPGNAENWSGGKKAYHVFYIGLQCFVMYVPFHIPDHTLH